MEQMESGSPFPHCWFLQISTRWFSEPKHMFSSLFKWYSSFRFSLKCQNSSDGEHQSDSPKYYLRIKDLWFIQHGIHQQGSDLMETQVLSFKQAERFLGEYPHQNPGSGPSPTSLTTSAESKEGKRAKMDTRAFLRLLWLRSQVIS